jgi:hypothetical protein
MQKGVFGICVVKDATNVVQYKNNEFAVNKIAIK